ncbi:MAG: hypothetical protein JWR69_3807, partial [Pedosphaera sp.]|nr:hypothetical protein [Pedosphaera sp.]
MVGAFSGEGFRGFCFSNFTQAFQSSQTTSGGKVFLGNPWLL